MSGGKDENTNLVCLQAVVKESLRLHLAGPFGWMRKFSKDCNVGGYHILKGTWMAVNLWKANFGLSIMQLVLANLLHAFYFSNVNDQEVDMTGSAGLANIKLTPFDVLVAPRLSPSLR
ncbi:hypothetical protein ACS0TY_018510 [Phlomoides rotata]